MPLPFSPWDEAVIPEGWVSAGGLGTRSGLCALRVGLGVGLYPEQGAQRGLRMGWVLFLPWVCCSGWWCGRLLLVAWFLGVLDGGAASPASAGRGVGRLG